MKKFKIGEEVIALSTQTAPDCQNRVKGQHYIIKDVRFCSKCGIQVINIQGVCSFIINSECSCGSVTKGLNMEYTNSRHFVKADDLEVRIGEAEKAENYELAGFLLSTLNEMG